MHTKLNSSFQIEFSLFIQATQLSRLFEKAKHISHLKKKTKPSLRVHHCQLVFETQPAPVNVDVADIHRSRQRFPVGSLRPRPPNQTRQCFTKWQQHSSAFHVWSRAPRQSLSLSLSINFVFSLLKFSSGSSIWFGFATGCAKLLENRSEGFGSSPMFRTGLGKSVSVKQSSLAKAFSVLGDDAKTDTGTGTGTTISLFSIFIYAFVLIFQISFC